MIRRMNEHLAEGNHVGRTHDVVARFFDGLDLLEPGVVKVTEWRPESAIDAAGPTSLWGGVARKPSCTPSRSRKAPLARSTRGLSITGVLVRRHGDQPSEREREA